MSDRPFCHRAVCGSASASAMYVDVVSVATRSAPTSISCDCEPRALEPSMPSMSFFHTPSCQLVMPLPLVSVFALSQQSLHMIVILTFQLNVQRPTDVFLRHYEYEEGTELRTRLQTQSLFTVPNVTRPVYQSSLLFNIEMCVCVCVCVCYTGRLHGRNHEPTWMEHGTYGWTSRYMSRLV